MMHEWWNGWGPGGGMVFGWLFMLVLLAVLVAGLLALLRYLTGTGGPAGAQPRTPREILDERFAKGEIDKDEYEARRKTLGV